jgi:hypothetical protein
LARSKPIVKSNRLRLLGGTVNKVKKPFLDTLILSVCRFLQLDHKWPISRTWPLEKTVDSRLVKNIDSVLTATPSEELSDSREEYFARLETADKMKGETIDAEWELPTKSKRRVLGERAGTTVVRRSARTTNLPNDEVT